MQFSIRFIVTFHVSVHHNYSVLLHDSIKQQTCLKFQFRAIFLATERELQSLIAFFETLQSKKIHKSKQYNKSIDISTAPEPPLKRPARDADNEDQNKFVIFFPLQPYIFDTQNEF